MLFGSTPGHSGDLYVLGHLNIWGIRYARKLDVFLLSGTVRWCVGKMEYEDRRRSGCGKS